jgi:heme/copper-type cytochrome/quinol oxidase subunit 1
MRLIDGLSKTQRIVVVVALGLALGVVGTYLVNLGSGIRFGWYAYSPLTATTFQAPGTGLPSWLRLIVWLVLIGLWALASIRVLRPRADQSTPD